MLNFRKIKKKKSNFSKKPEITGFSRTSGLNRYSILISRKKQISNSAEIMETSKKIMKLSFEIFKIAQKH